MADYSGTILTTAGINLQAKAQIGQQLELTRVALGDGAEPANIAALDDLVNPRQSLGIQSVEAPGDGTGIVSFFMSNQGVDDGFFVREIGVFARDPNTGNEHLYSYTYAGDRADFMAAEGGPTVQEELVQLITIVGQAENVTAVINEHLTLATKQDLDALEPRLMPDEAPAAGSILTTDESGAPHWASADEALEDAYHFAMLLGA
ncbi:phage tail protein [Epibacterium ulvae]|uniref:phage tail-collar fiber domain-containing protein n=1 Tax=Epibacterium ulvae TaxID=1156985 RepID=UPI002492C6FA|nr:phage tail protein [Epibacterium ulvae]